MSNARKFAFGLAVLGASLGAGMTWASAQTDTTTPAPTTEEAPATAGERDGDCPEKDGAATGGSGTGTATNAAIRLARRA